MHLKHLSSWQCASHLGVTDAQVSVNMAASVVRLEHSVRQRSGLRSPWSYVEQRFEFGLGQLFEQPSPGGDLAGRFRVVRLTAEANYVGWLRERALGLLCRDHARRPTYSFGGPASTSIICQPAHASPLVAVPWQVANW